MISWELHEFLISKKYGRTDHYQIVQILSEINDVILEYFKIKKNKLSGDYRERTQAFKTK